MIQVAVMGYGTIGSGVVEVLETNKDKITEKTGKEIAVKYILDLREFPGDPHEAQIVHDFEIIEKDEEVEIVVEAMGGVNPAYKFAKACLLAGKHVVTSNKALVAAHGTELLAIAREKNLNFLFEASVGGGIPVLHPLTQCMAANRVDEIYGILNGTTNFILTKMVKEGASFAEVLKLAQEKGYAEADPTADVEGIDAGRKICILADADSDGLHIATLLCALFVRHFRTLVKEGHVYVALPPLYRIDLGKEVYYALTEEEKTGVLEQLKRKKGKPNVQRFKGLGEMNPMQLRETTLDPNTRRLVQLVISDEDEQQTTAIMDMLLAKKRSEDRRNWLQEKGDMADLEV